MGDKFVGKIIAAMCLIGVGGITSGIAQSVAVGDRASTAKSVVVTIEAVNAPLTGILQSIARQSGLHFFGDDDVLNSKASITLHLRGVPVEEAFAKALAGTGLQAKITTSMVTFVRDAAAAQVAQGRIAGKVVDAKTKTGLRGATVTLDDATQGTTSGDEGGFHIANVVPGEHVLHIRLLGYGKATKIVTVVEGQIASIAVVLEQSASALDQVVVTGTVLPTEMKAVPNAITIITAKQIEDRGITRIDQLFRGDVPGVFAQKGGTNTLLDEVTMFSRGATALSNVSAGIYVTGLSTDVLSNPIKTYVDGVELADSKYLSQIDPGSIERIEILTGPQASTIYGSNAINGVMQIFTKRGASSRPQLRASLLSGWVENNFSSARTPQHDYSAQVNGVEGRLSYNAGGSWNYIGPWSPAKQTSRIGGFGGTRLEIPTAIGRMTADVTLRRSMTQNKQRGAEGQTTAGYQETGWYTASGAVGMNDPTTYILNGQTLGLILGYAPNRWWSHELGIGVDASDTEQRITTRGYIFPGDTTLLLSQNHTDLRSLHYTTSVRVPLTALAQATVTAGTDAWQQLNSSMIAQPQTLTGTLTNVTSVTRQPDHNTGAFLQTQLGVQDRLFFTFGVRAEWNPAYGEDEQPNYAPRYGIAYTQELGGMTVKLRASYGRSTRPPQSKLKEAVKASEFLAPSAWAALSPYYEDFDDYLANPELGPEHQQGGEGGVELYFGARGSLVITRYNQTVNDLIAGPRGVDSVRSLTACRPTCSTSSPIKAADGYGYQYQSQYVNLGSIRNQGWELQGSLHVGPVMTQGTYSWTKSRTIGVNSKYRWFFTPLGYPQYQPGASFQYVPEHTWALGITFARSATTVALNLTGTGQVKNLQDDFFVHSLSANIRLTENLQRQVTLGSQYTSFNGGYTLADLTMSHTFLPRMEGVLQIQNLTDNYTNDFSAGYVSMGRQLKGGFRLR